jgi:tetratricopeptide (TPR) repeat protein
MIRRFARSAPAVLGLAVCLTAATAAGAQSHRPSASPLDDAIHEAFHAAYNLDYAEAVAAARRAVAAGPNESRAHRALASIVWLEILFRRGAVSVDHYMGNVTRMAVTLPKPPPDLDAEFKREIGLALRLAQQRLDAMPEDVQATYDLGAAYGIQATYVASVEGRIGAAFQSARRAFNAQESVLELDPRRLDAGLIVGTYRYIVSTMSLPTRWLAYMVGFGGGKERGISMLEAAARTPEVSVDARTALMLIYSREGRHADVVRIARELGAEYPRNRLFVLEEGAAAIRAGRALDADQALTRGLSILERDNRAKVPGERALWLYKRGLARLNLNRLPDADVDLREALRAGPVGWVGGRIHVALGKIADLGGRRADAVAAYRTGKAICEQANDPIGAAEANRLLRRPFSFAGRGTPPAGAR